jgi:hypothetical protein
MPRVGSPAPEDTTSTSPLSEVEVPVAPAPTERPLPPNPGVGGSYLLDPVEWVWVLQPEA